MAHVDGEKPKITIASSLSVPFKSGSGLNAFRLAATFVKLGYNVTHFTYDWGGKYPRHEWQQGVHIFRSRFFWSFYGDSKSKLYASVPFVIFYYARAIYSSEVVILFGPMGSFRILSLCIIIAKLLRKKVIYRSTMLGGDDITQLIERFSNPSTKKILGALDGYWSLSPAFTQSYLRHIPSPEKVLESFQGVDTQQFFPPNPALKSRLRRKYKLSSEKTILISVGYVNMRKGYDDIFNILSQINSPFVYLVVGQYRAEEYNFGEKERKEMKKLYNQGLKDLSGRIQFIGERDNVWEWLQLSDIFIMNSHKEGVPNVLLEAMACSLAIATSPIPGVAEKLTIHNVNAEVFSTNSEMYASISKLILNTNYRQNLGKQASKMIMENYSIRQVANRLIKKYLM